MTLPLDHWNVNAGTYENRFWASEQYYEPGGPVFIFDAGEVDAENSTNFDTVHDGRIQLLEEFNVIGINWSIGTTAH